MRDKITMNSMAVFKIYFFLILLCLPVLNLTGLLSTYYDFQTFYVFCICLFLCVWYGFVSLLREKEGMELDGYGGQGCPERENCDQNLLYKKINFQ